MSISFDIPAELEAGLTAELGDLNQAAKEAFVIESYRSGKISVGIVARLLALDSRWGAERRLKERNVSLPLSHDDLNAEQEALDTILGPER